MQRAASSDTLSTMSFSNADAQCHNSAALHDAKQPLSHSQSMILPENGKVLTSRAHTHTHREGRKLCVFTDTHTQNADFAHTGHMHTHMQTNEHRS